MRQYNRVMAGAKSVYAEQCFRSGFIGIDYGIQLDLTGRLPDNWREFNKESFVLSILGAIQKKQRSQRGSRAASSGRYPRG